MKYRTAAVVALYIICLLIPVPADAAAGQKITVDGYRFSISVNQTGRKLKIRGIVSGGKSCQRLVARLSLYDENGKTTCAKIVMHNYSVNERFNVQKSTCKHGGRWKVADIFITTHK